VLCPKLDGATLKGAWFGALDSQGVSIKVDAVDRKALPQWIAQRLSLQHQRVPSGEAGQRTLQFFADRVEGNLLAAHQEVQKLALLYPAGELSFEQVESAVLNVARYDSFKLAEAVLAGQTARVQRMLDGLQAEGEAPVLVHWALSEDIRTLARVRQALDAGRPMPMALRENRVWGAKEKLMERVLPRLSADDAGAVVARRPRGRRYFKRAESGHLARRPLGRAAPPGHAGQCRVRCAQLKRLIGSIPSHLTPSPRRRAPGRPANRLPTPCTRCWLPR
jgi:DNA polymerase III delta subunit